MVKRQVDSTGNQMFQAMQQQERLRRDLEQMAKTKESINLVFPLFSPASMLHRRLQQRLTGEETPPLRVDGEEHLPSFVYDDMAILMKAVVIAMNPPDEVTSDYWQRQTAADSLESLRLMLKSPEFADRYDLFDFASRLREMAGLSQSRPKPQTTYASSYHALQAMTSTIRDRDSGPAALKLAPAGRRDYKEPQTLESEVFTIPVTASRLEALAHELSQKLGKPIEEVVSWNEFPTHVKQRLLEFNSLSAIIHILRMMGIRQNQLVDSNTRHVGAILNCAEIRNKFGKFTPAFKQKIVAFIERIYDYSDTELWHQYHQFKVYPMIGWNSLKGLAQADLVRLATVLDESCTVEPGATVKAEYSDVEGLDTALQSWMKPVTYPRLVKYRAQYSSLYAELNNSAPLWADILSDEQWLQHHIGRSWTSRLLRQSVNLFPSLKSG